MARDITATYVSSSVGTIRCEYAVILEFSGSAPTRLWSGIENKTLTDYSGSATYTGVGSLGSISAISETTEVSARGIELTLSGIPSNYVSLALQNNYRGRTAAVYLLLFNIDRSSYQQSMIFRGRMDQMIISEGETNSTITVKCESRLVDLNRARETRYTDEYQKSIFPNDTGLEFMSGMADKSIYWGTESPTTNVSSPIGGGGGDNNVEYNG